MTVSVQTPIVEYAPNGVTTVFAYPFAILNQDDLALMLDGAPVTSGFTVSGVGDEGGGAVTFSSAPTGSKLIIYRSVILEREVDYQENGDLPAETLDQDFDRIWMALQDQLLVASQTVRAPLGEALNEMPAAASRALRVLGFDSSGQPVMLTRTDDGGSALALDMLDAADATKGPALLGHNATLNYAAGTVGAVLNDSCINVKMFPWLAKCDGTTDDSAALNAAFASGYGSFILPGVSVIASDVTLPSGKSLLGLPGVGEIKSTGGNFIFSGNQTIENVKFDMNGTAKQVYGEGADNVTTKHCEFTGSTNNGLLMSVGPRFYKSVHDKFHGNGKAGLYVAGTVADAPFNITVDHPYAYHNGEGGVVVAGVGERTSPPQTANYADIITITAPVCHDNGTTANSGVEVFYATNVQVSSPICYDNFEHGVSLQEVSGFCITSPICRTNGQAGICAQSGYDPYVPTESGTIMGGVLTGNNSGLLLKEVCSNIQVIGTDMQDNTTHAARLVDIGGSGLKSNDITFMGCSGVPTGGSTITNSNGSTNITAGNGLNHFGTTVQVNMMVNESVASSLTISTIGATETYPEMITLTAGADTQRCGIGQAYDTRRLTLRAAAGATISIQHNQGDGVTYAGFLNSSGATAVIANGQSITYVANGVNFVQMG